MLIEFSVSNFRSIRDKITLSLVASTDKEMWCQNSFDSGIPELRLLRSVVIYGPNASGKTNLVEAINFVRSFISTPTLFMIGQNRPDFQPFLLDAQSRKKPSEFEIHFIQNEVRYQYGFALDRSRVIKEWLIAFPEGRPQRWFERKYISKSKKDDWYFGPNFRGMHKHLETSTRKEALFLSTAMFLNNQQLKPISEWFTQKLGLCDDGDYDFSANLNEDNIHKEELIKLIKIADPSIEDMKVENEKMKVEPALFKELKKLDVGSSKTSDGEIEMKNVMFSHKIIGSKKRVFFDFEQESAGTQRLFDFSGPLLDTLSNGIVLVVDELNNSLHSLLLCYFVNLFHNPKANPNNAQLIFTTHDTSILKNDVFRRDQVWFVEKNKKNATELFPLTDFKPRNKEALEKGYLQGRYGALPVISELNF